MIGDGVEKLTELRGSGVEMIGDGEEKLTELRGSSEEMIGDGEEKLTEILGDHIIIQDKNPGVEANIKY